MSKFSMAAIVGGVALLGTAFVISLPAPANADSPQSKITNATQTNLSAARRHWRHHRWHRRWHHGRYGPRRYYGGYGYPAYGYAYSPYYRPYYRAPGLYFGFGFGPRW